MKRPLVFITIIALIVAGFLLLQNAGEPPALVSEEPVTALPSGEFTIDPIQHASFIMTLGDTMAFVDPTGDATQYTAAGFPDLVLLTDTDGDHFDIDTLNAVVGPDTTLIAPQVAFDELPEPLAGQTVVMGNGDQHVAAGIGIEALPMYNLPESPDAYHVKGVGNGYILSQADTRVYIAGDTDDTPELRAVEDIDYALVPMNPPYTMDVDVAADAVLDFAPRVVMPYHYRTPDGLNDIDEFERLVAEGNEDIEVRLLDWYPEVE